MSHNPVALFQFSIDWQQPTPDEFEQGFYLRASISPEVAFDRSFGWKVSLRAGGTFGAPFFNSLSTPSRLTFLGLELRSPDNAQYIYVEQDGVINGDGGAPVLFDGGVGKQKGSDLAFNGTTGQITSTAGGLFDAYFVLNLAHG